MATGIVTKTVGDGNGGLIAHRYWCPDTSATPQLLYPAPIWIDYTTETPINPNAASPVTQSGTWNFTPLPRATGNGTTSSRVVAAATTNATSLKGSAGNIAQMDLFNVAAYDVFFKYYNKATAPTLALATPVNAAFATATTGGTLAAATYFYRVSALNANGETLASTETSQVTSGTTSTVTVNWGAVTGATGYKVYGRTTGAELLIATVGAVTTYIDTGAVSPAGALPAANTTADTPTWTIPIKAGTGYSAGFVFGKSFAAGIAYAITKLVADSDTTALAAGDVTGSIDWI